MSKICVGKGIKLSPLQLEEKIGKFLTPANIALHEGDALAICDQAIKMLLGRKYTVDFVHFNRVSYGGSTSTKLDYWGCDICFVGVCKEVYRDVQLETTEDVFEGLATFLPGLIDAYQMIQKEPIETLEHYFHDFLPGVKTFSKL